MYVRYILSSESQGGNEFGICCWKVYLQLENTYRSKYFFPFLILICIATSNICWCCVIGNINTRHTYWVSQSTTHYNYIKFNDSLRVLPIYIKMGLINTYGNSFLNVSVIKLNLSLYIFAWTKMNCFQVHAEHLCPIHCSSVPCICFMFERFLSAGYIFKYLQNQYYLKNVSFPNNITISN